MPTPSSRTHILFSIVLLVCSLALAIGAGEVILRVKNSSMKTYDIEMWRYAKDLKVRSDDPALDFDHVKSRSSVLQGVTIRLNEWGLRGGRVERPRVGFSRRRHGGGRSRTTSAQARAGGAGAQWRRGQLQYQALRDPV